MTIPDEAVEAAAKAIHEAGGFYAWEDPEGWREVAARNEARAALEAAAPILMAQAWNEGCAATTRAVRSGADYPVNPYKVVP